MLQLISEASPYSDRAQSCTHVHAFHLIPSTHISVLLTNAADLQYLAPFIFVSNDCSLYVMLYCSGD
jgi:hypothetical protein